MPKINDQITTSRYSLWSYVKSAYSGIKQIRLWKIALLYGFFSSIMFLIARLFFIQNKLNDSLSYFLYTWQSFFHPAQMLFMKYQGLSLNPDFAATSHILTAIIDKMSWIWLPVLLIFDLAAILILALSINLIAQKIFILTDKIKPLLTTILIVNILSSIIIGIPLINLVKNSSQVILILGLFLSIWLILEFRNIYQTNLRKSILLFLLIFPLFPLAILLLIFYALLELPFLKRNATAGERTVRVWFELLYSPGQALIQIQSQYSRMAALFFFSMMGMAGIYLLFKLPLVTQLYPSYQSWLWGFIALFHKTEVATIYISHNFSLAQLPYFTLPGWMYFYLFAQFLLTLFIITALIDFTSWTLYKTDKHFRLVLTHNSMILSAGMALFLILAYFFILISVFIKQFIYFEMTQILFYLAIALSTGVALWVITQIIRSFAHTYAADTARGILLWLNSLILIPISLAILVFNALVELARYIAAPLRHRTYRTDLARLNQINQATSNEDVNSAIEDFVDHLKNRYSYNISARRSVNMQAALSSIIQYHPKVIITNLLSLAESKNHELRQDAVQWLATIFTINASSHIRLFYYILEQKTSPQLLAEIANNIDMENPWNVLIFKYYELMRASAISDDETKVIFAISEDLNQLKTDSLSGEFYIIYKIIGTLAQMRSLREITLVNELVDQYLKIPAIQENSVLEIFKLLLRVSNYQALYERSQEENKMPFLSMQLVILVEIQRKLEALKNRDIEKFVLTSLTTKIQNWAMTQINMLRGEIELIVDLKTESIPANEDESVIVVNMHNAGTTLAQNIRLTLEAQPNDFYKIIGEATKTNPLIEPKADQSFEFTISPLKAGTQRMLFKGSYFDIDNREFTFEHGDMIRFAEMEITDTREYKIGEIINPYIAGRAVAEPRMFFGRNEEYNKIRANLEGQYQDNIIVIHGQRRAGKSSMLLQMQHHLSPDRYICVFIDLESIVARGLSSFFFRLATAIYRDLDKLNIKIDRPVLDNFTREPAEFFRDTFLASISQKIGNRKLLLMLDEFEYLEYWVNEGRIERDIFPFMRNLMQHSQNLSFILAGAHRLTDLRDEYWQLLFNITKYIKVGFLDKESSQQLICKPVENYVTYDPLATDKIYTITAGQPFFIQLICHELFGLYKRRKKNYLTIHDVNGAIELVIETGAGHLDYLWNSANWHEKIVMTAIADISVYDSEKVRLGAIGNRLKELYFDYQEKDVREALSRLVDLEILSSDSRFENFWFKVDLIRQWLKVSHSVSKTIEEYRMGPMKS